MFSENEKAKKIRLQSEAEAREAAIDRTLITQQIKIEMLQIELYATFAAVGILVVTVVALSVRIAQLAGAA
jgi:hypothetical protein